MAVYNDYSAKNSETSKIIRSLLLGCAVGIGMSAALLSLCAILFVKFGSLPLDYLPLITTFIGAAGSFSAGYASVRLYRKRGLLIGICAGFVLFLTVFLTGLVKGLETDLVGAFIKCCVFIVVGAIGGILSVNKRIKVKRM